MTKFQSWFLILLAIALAYGIFRAESVLRRVDTVVATTNRALDNLERAQAVIVASTAAIEKASGAAHGLLDRVKPRREEPKP